MARSSQLEQLMKQVELLVDSAWVPALLLHPDLSIARSNAAARNLFGPDTGPGAYLHQLSAPLAAWVAAPMAEQREQMTKKLNLLGGPGIAPATATAHFFPHGLEGCGLILLAQVERGIAKPSQNRDPFASILGNSPNLVACKEAAAAFASKESNILLLGETGTGKEVFARAIHGGSRRSRGPFIAVNCAAIPESLLESELFGYDSGAFTDARRGGKPGKVELASNGTLFLDEIGDMSPLLQAKLLRVLQDRLVERLGGTSTVKVDFRLIAATNQSLEERVEQGLFRRDLFYRLNVLPIRIPPLRSRRPDILVIARHVLYAYGSGQGVYDFAPDAEAALLAHDWPGNVRELENVVQYCLSIETGPLITAQSLPRYLPRTESPTSGLNLEMFLESMERELVRDALLRHPGAGGRIEAAKELGISRAGLYRRIQKFGFAEISMDSASGETVGTPLAHSEWRGQKRLGKGD